MIHLVTGGARSGKSAFVLRLVESNFPEGKILFIATAQAFDAELALRIERHRQERGPRFETWEVPFNLPESLIEARRYAPVVIVDCLTVWMGNLLCAPELSEQGDAWIEGRIADLGRALQAEGSPVFLVTNEVGMGIVPDNALSRRYRDHLGRCNAHVAALADRVDLLVSGLPLRLK